MFESAHIFLTLKKIMSGDDKDVRTLLLYTCKILVQLGYICTLAGLWGFAEKQRSTTLTLF